MIRTSEIGSVSRFDIARTILRKGYYWTVAYYIDGLLIDSGCAHCASELLQALRDRPVIYLVNTHSHEDHIGGNALLQKKYPGLRIFAHPLAAPVLADPVNKQPLHFYQKFMWGYPEPSSAFPVKDGDELTTKHYRFKIIYTPGHSEDHICLYEPDQQWLFSGDLFVGGHDQALRSDYDIRRIIESLKIVSNLSMRTMFPGCAKVRYNPIEEIREKISYLEKVGEEVLKLHQNGVEPQIIAKKLLKKHLFIEIFTGGHFSRKNMVLSFLKKMLSEENKN